jgi:transcription antitermination factor NusG
MAGPTITRNVNFSWNNGTTSVGNAVKTATLLGDVTNSRAFSNTQLVGTAEEPVELLDVSIAQQYVVMLTNKDATNYVVVKVEVSAAAYHIIGRIYPGESWGPVRMPMPASTPYPRLAVEANAGACDVEVVCGEAARA